MQCPMEAIHGRRSALHNGISGAILGYVGVSTHRIGIPFVDPFSLMRYPFISPAMAGAAVYGSFGLGLAMLGGKRI